MRWMAALFVTMMVLPTAAYAQADEIQVYDGGLAEPGVFNLTLHNNWIAEGISTPAFPGAVAADKSFNGVPEWAYGVNRWFELGLYLPLYSRDDRTGWGVNGFKLRTLFAVPNADDRTFFYGANIEYSFNNKRWDTKRFTSEVRPIVGWHLSQWDLIFNPIIDTAYDGLKNLEFVPGSRLAYNVSPKLAFAVEEYAGFGPLRDFVPRSEQSHQVFGVFDYNGKAFSVEGGIGFGLTDASDDLTFKVILSHDFNQPRKRP